MRIKTLIISQLIALSPLFLTPCFGQDTYRVGFSSVSLEPDDRFVSLALAGYAAPWEGRYTLQWEEQKELPPKLPPSCEQASCAVTVAGEKLYIVDEEGQFHVADPNDKKLQWQKAPFYPLKEVVSLAGDADKLFALTREGFLYQQGGHYQQGRWIKIGYKNGVTVNEDIRSILLAGNQLFGVDVQNKLYRAAHRSKQELSARALSITSGDKTVVVVALDLTGINDTFTAQVKEELYRKRALPPSSVFINSSHTHYAPVTQKWLTWQESNRHADSTYLYSFVRQAIFRAVEESLDHAKEAELYVGRGHATLGFNRSLSDWPDLYDDAVDVVRFRFTDDQSEGLLFMAACHPVFCAPNEHFTLSANFPGVVRKILDEERGITRTLFLQGTAGDINPVDPTDLITGEKLAREVMAVIDAPMQRVSGPLTCYLDTVELEVAIPSEKEMAAFAHDPVINENFMLKERNQTWEKIMQQERQQGLTHFPMPVYVHTLNVGNWKLVGFSRETTTSYGLRVKELWPEQMVSVAGYTNDVSSYLPTRLHIEKRNYEGMDSFYWYGMPDTYPPGVEETIITKIKQNNR